MRYLDLSGNDFNGTTIPLFVASLENLRYLNLSWSGFGGRIPSQLSNLSNLEYLDISGNYQHDDMGDNYLYGLHTVDLAWFKHLPLLSNLDMSDVDLSHVQDWVYLVNMHSSLRVLRLADCGLTSTMSVTSRSNLPHLQVLDLSGNLFNTTLEHYWFWDLIGLKKLHLGACDWHGPIPEELGNMTSLQVIDLGLNYLVGLIPSNLQNLCKLKVLNFEYNNINASIEEFMHRLPRCSWSTIQEFSVGYASMSGELPIWIGNMTSLTVLSASQNMITGTMPMGVGALGNLTVLELGDNKLEGVLTKDHLSGLQNLEYLDLSHNSFKMHIDPDWLPPFRLKSINLESCTVGPRFPERLRWQTNIESLCLANTSLDDVIPDWFWMTFSQAWFLDASGNMLHGSLPSNLQHMPTESLSLGCNNLTGLVPRLLPINISKLHLSSNSLSGSLPLELKAQ